MFISSVKPPIPLILAWALLASGALAQNRSSIDLYGGGLIGETTWVDIDNLRPQMPVFAAFGSSGGHNATLVNISGDLDDLLWVRDLYQGRFFYLGEADTSGALSYNLVIPDVPEMENANLYIQALTYDSSFSSGPDMFDSVSNLVLLKPSYEGEWRDHEESLPAAAHQAYAIQMRTERGGATKVLITGGGSALFQEAASKFETTDQAYEWDTTLQMMNPLPNMHEERAAHTATQLQDGRILITGGMHYAGTDNAGYRTEVTDGVEIWNPETWSFEQLPPMNEPRAFHQAVLLNDGRVLVLGGATGWGTNHVLHAFDQTVASAIRSTEIWNPTTFQWTQGPNMPTTNIGCRAVKDPAGAILVAGGINQQNQVHPLVFRFDPQATYVQEVGQMKAPRAFFSMVLLRDNRVFVAGGYEGDATNLFAIKSTELFDPQFQAFEFSTPLPEAIAMGTAVQGILGNNMVYITGGTNENVGLVSGTTMMTFNPGNESTASGRTSNQDHGGGIVIMVGNGAVGVVTGAGSTPWGQAEGESMAPMGD